MWFCPRRNIVLSWADQGLSVAPKATSKTVSWAVAGRPPCHAWVAGTCSHFSYGCLVQMGSPGSYHLTERSRTWPWHSDRDPDRGISQPHQSHLKVRSREGLEETRSVYFFHLPFLHLLTQIETPCHMATPKRHNIIILYLPKTLYNQRITQLQRICVHVGRFQVALVWGGTDLSGTDFRLGFSIWRLLKMRRFPKIQSKWSSSFYL